MKLQALVVSKAIIPELAATERDEAIAELVGALVSAGAAPASIKDDLTKSILDREKKGSTGFGKGVAVPHAKHPKVKTIAAAIGVSSKGIDFHALDKAPVYTIVLLLSPTDKTDEHLEAMQCLFDNLTKDQFRKFLRQSSTVKEVEELLQEADNQQLAG